LKDTVNEEVNKMLQKCVVHPSASHWSSPAVMVRKKDGTWQFSIVFWKLNVITHQDACPLPRIDETLKMLAYFTTLNLASGYWQVEVQEQDKYDWGIWWKAEPVYQ